jgi:hypothetical protein
MRRKPSCAGPCVHCKSSKQILCEQQEDLFSITDIAVKSYCFQFSLDINLISNLRGRCVSCEQKAKQYSLLLLLRNENNLHSQNQEAVI